MNKRLPETTELSAVCDLMPADYLLTRLDRGGAVCVASDMEFEKGMTFWFPSKGIFEVVVAGDFNEAEATRRKDLEHERDENG